MLCMVWLQWGKSAKLVLQDWNGTQNLCAVCILLLTWEMWSIFSRRKLGCTALWGWLLSRKNGMHSDCNPHYRTARSRWVDGEGHWSAAVPCAYGNVAVMDVPHVTGTMAPNITCRRQSSFYGRIWTTRWLLESHHLTYLMRQWSSGIPSPKWTVWRTTLTSLVFSW